MDRRLATGKGASGLGLLGSPVFESVISLLWTSSEVKRNLQVQNQEEAPHTLPPLENPGILSVQQSM